MMVGMCDGGHVTCVMVDIHTMLWVLAVNS